MTNLNKTKQALRSVAASLLLAAAASLAVPVAASNAQDYFQASIDVADLFAQLGELRADVSEARDARPEHIRVANTLRPQLVAMRRTFADLQRDATNLLIDQHERGVGIREVQSLIEFINWAGATGRALGLGVDVTNLIANEQIWDEAADDWNSEYKLTGALHDMAGDIRLLWEYALDYRPDEYLRQLSGE